MSSSGKQVTQHEAGSRVVPSRMLLPECVSCPARRADVDPCRGVEQGTAACACLLRAELAAIVERCASCEHFLPEHCPGRCRYFGLWG